MNTIFNTIPRSINEIVYFLGFIGIFLFFVSRRQDKKVGTMILIAFFMIFWRVLIKINSSRYAVGLIYFFLIFFVYFFFSLSQTSNRLKRFILASTVLFVIIVWTKKNYFVSRNTSNITAIAEIHSKLNTRNQDVVLLTPRSDFKRISYYENEKHSIENYLNHRDISDVYYYMTNNHKVHSKILYNIIENINSKQILHKQSSPNHVMSVFSGKRKRNNLYLVEPQAEYCIISNSVVISPESGILNNGDLEIVDSPEQSLKKLNTHISNFSLFNNYDLTIRTPYNAYFHNDPGETKLLPYYNCTDLHPISGNYSAHIKSNGATSFILFSQKIYSGAYDYSIIVRGKKGTTVCLLYDLYKHNHWNPTPIVFFTIPDKRTYKISTSFFIDNLSSEVFFLIGAYIQKGEAYLDNFFLTKHVNSDSK